MYDIIVCSTATGNAAYAQSETALANKAAVFGKGASAHMGKSKLQLHRVCFGILRHTVHHQDTTFEYEINLSAP